MKILKNILVDVIANLIINLIGSKIAANKQQESSNDEVKSGDK